MHRLPSARLHNGQLPNCARHYCPPTYTPRGPTRHAVPSCPAQDEAAALEAEMEGRHGDELRALDERIAAQQGDGGPVDAVAAALAANSLYGKAAEGEDSKQARALEPA